MTAACGQFCAQWSTPPHVKHLGPPWGPTTIIWPPGALHLGPTIGWPA